VFGFASLNRILSSTGFDCLSHTLRSLSIRNAAPSSPWGAIALGEMDLDMADLAAINFSLDDQAVFADHPDLQAQRQVSSSYPRFTLVLSPAFSGLLIGLPVESRDDIEAIAYRVQLSFAPTVIAAFIAQVQGILPSDSMVQLALASGLQHLQENDPTQQAEFTLALAEVLTQPMATTPILSSVQPATDWSVVANPASASLESAQFVADQPASPTAQQKLNQQIDQERVFTEVATQIRQTQELPLILENAIQLVRASLKADRVVIYELEANLDSLDAPLANGEADARSMLNDSRQLVCGQISYEARASHAIPRILNLKEGARCFLGVHNYQEKYRRGSVQAIANIEATYAAAPCLVGLLNWAKVKAKLVAPIVVQGNLWGLLIAHQCSGTRRWQPSEVRFMRVMAELFAIAIHQTNLYSQLQQQAQNLEQLVINRTQELHDALAAAQSANLTKTEFLASVSHELRTPLAAIIGMATTLLRLSDARQPNRALSPAKQQDYLSIIRNSGEHLLALINDILDLSQLEAGRATLNVHAFSLTHVATESIQTLRDRANQRGVGLTLELNLGVEQPMGVSLPSRDRFIADPQRVKQILLNLLSNAIKFTPAEGRVTLRVWREANRAFFQVEDTGIGIPEEQFSLLFTKFQQLDASYHRQYEGTGLGLALTRQLVELHGGKIEVESTVNVGSLFTAWIPAQPLLPKRPEANALEAGDRADPTEGRVMLIESDETSATLICDLLITAGHQVIWMIDGLTATQQIEVLQPAVILISAQLLGMGAGHILQQLRQTPQTQGIKILLLAPQTTNALCDRWMAEGADACIPMPLQYPEQLLNTVAELLHP
jgi:two-component system, sensor histidine kinase and response regulator